MFSVFSKFGIPSFRANENTAKRFWPDYKHLLSANFVLFNHVPLNPFAAFT